jgi:hypothetical protein
VCNYPYIIGVFLYRQQLLLRRPGIETQNNKGGEERGVEQTVSIVCTRYSELLARKHECNQEEATINI